MNQHLIRSILAIRAHGGLASEGDVIWPEPLLVGRSEAKLAALASEHGLERWTTDLDAALADPEYEIYFDAQLTSARPPAVEAAIAAGKHVYCEKPVTPDVESALALATGGARRGREGRRRAGQVVPARAVEAPAARRVRLLRAHHRRARRVRLLGLSGAGAEAAASVVELPLRGRGRHHQRHVRSLALRARQRLRARAVGDGARRHAHPDPGRRGRGRIRRDGRGRRVRDVRDRGRGGRAAELVVVRARESRRAVRAAGRRDATAAPSPACASARCSRPRRRRRRSGTPTCRTRSRTARPWTEVPERRSAGERLQAPVGALPAPRGRSTNRSRGTSWRARAACSCPSSASSRGASVAGSTCRS